MRTNTLQASEECQPNEHECVWTSGQGGAVRAKGGVYLRVRYVVLARSLSAEQARRVEDE